jgi:DNA-binding transcriptional MerR regulator
MRYTIREIARLFGVTVGGIRFFEDRGLVNPERDISGNRVYNLGNILELAHLRKYCSFGITIKQVAEYFTAQNTKDFREVVRLLDVKEEEAKRKARYYEQSARWIASYNEKLKHVDEYIDHFTLITEPDYLMLIDGQCPDDPLVGKSRRQQELLCRWVEAQPLSSLRRIFHFEKGRMARSILTLMIPKAQAEELALPIPANARTLKSCSSLYRIVKDNKTGPQPIDEKDSTSLVREVLALGHAFSGIMISTIFFAHRMNGIPHRYFEIHIPVDCDFPLFI